MTLKKLLLEMRKELLNLSNNNLDYSKTTVDRMHNYFQGKSQAYKISADMVKVILKEKYGKKRD